MTEDASCFITSRRAFGRTLVATTAAGFLPAGLMGTSNPSMQPAAIPEGLSLADWHEVQAKQENLLRKYGSRLSEAEKKRTLSILIANQHMLASIRSLDVENSDAAACTLRLVP